LNTDSRQVCEIAILGDANWLPDRAAKVCFQNQHDFNYLEINHLVSDALTDADGVHLGGINYSTVILDGLSNLPDKVVPVLHKLEESGRLIIYENSPFTSVFPKAILAKNPKDLMTAVEKRIQPDLMLNPSSTNIRYRHVLKEGIHYYMIFNEEATSVTTKVKIPLKGKQYWLDEINASSQPVQQDKPVEFEPHELKILMVKE
jgi:hypothetical protein